MVLAAFIAVSPAFAQDADGMVKVQSGLTTPGIGWSWGAGAIMFQGYVLFFRTRRFLCAGAGE